MLEFDQVFWDSIDFIGYTTRVRGRFPIFIDCVKAYDRPVLIVMCTGSEAEILETKKGKLLSNIVANYYYVRQALFLFFAQLTRIYLL